MGRIVRGLRRRVHDHDLGRLRRWNVGNKGQIRATHPGHVGNRVHTRRIHLANLRNRRLNVIDLERTLRGTRRTKMSLIRVDPGTRPPIYHVVSCNGFLCRGDGSSGRRGGGRGIVRIGRVGFHPNASRNSCRMGLHDLVHFLRRNSGTGVALHFHNHRVTRRRVNVRILGHIGSSLRRLTIIRSFPAGVRNHRVVVILTPGGGRWNLRMTLSIRPSNFANFIHLYFICWRYRIRIVGVPGVGAMHNTTGHFGGANGNNFGRGRTGLHRVLAGGTAGHGHRLHPGTVISGNSLNLMVTYLPCTWTIGIFGFLVEV